MNMFGKRFGNYLSDLKNLVFPQDQDEEIDQISKDAVKRYSQATSERNENVKVINQYPKQGAFRFPLIKDDHEKESPPSKKSTYPKKEMTTTKKYKSSVNPEKPEARKKFQGQHFSASTIPSPVYGYQAHEKRLTKLQKIARQSQTSDKLSLVPSEDIGEDQPVSEAVMERPLEKQEYQPVKEIEGKVKELFEGTETNKVYDTENLPEADSEVTNVTEESEELSTIEDNRQFRDQENVTPIRKENGGSEISSIQRPTFTREKRSKPKEIKTSNRENKQMENVPFNVLMHSKDRVRMKKREKDRQANYSFPPLHLLSVPKKLGEDDNQWLEEKKNQLNETFEYFHIKAKVVHVTKGPSVTRFEVQPDPGVKVSKIVNLTDDLKLSLAAKEIRIEAPIPGKNTIGVEVPNLVSSPVFLREILHHPSFQQSESPLTVAMGMDISGEPIVMDLQKMPHGLIAGATGSGKSVCVNSILTSLVYKASPSEVRMLLIDPKMVELAPYNNIPHLAAPVITDPKEATEGLKWAVSEMERRYECLAEAGARDIARYNEKMKRSGELNKHMPYLVIVVDELADLMMVSPHDVEEAICRIAQKARACGIHLLVATQRPSVDVITGLIKANIPTRIAFSVSSQVDSRTILDGGGAERLLGKGDMLLLENGSSKPIRIQGTFVTDDEIDRVVEFTKKSIRPDFLFEQTHLKEQIAHEGEDDLFDEACEFVTEQQAASASLLQRRFRMGYNRAARLIDDMEEKGIVSPAKGSKPRDVYLTKHDQKEENR